MADYPVRDGNNAVIIGTASDPAWSLPARYNYELDYPVLDKNGAVLVATPFGGVSFNLDAFMAAQADGLYFDTTKTDRFFQENTGPTLADDVGEAMGLALSQRAWDGRTLAEVLAGQTELVTNGGFDTDTVWSKTGAGWSISGGLATHAAGASGEIIQPPGVALANGRSYRVTGTMSGRTAGTLNVQCGGPGSVVAALSANGAFSVIVQAQGVGTNPNVRFIADSAFDGSLDSVSVKEVPGKHGIQATGTLKPTRQTTGAKFDGSDDNWLTSYTAGAGENFIVALVDVPASLSGTQMICGAGDATPNRFYLAINTSGNLVVGIGATGHTATSVDYRGQTLAIGFSLNGTTVRLFAADTEVLTASQSGVPTTTVPVRLGAYNNNGTAGNFFGGSITKLVAGRQFLDLATYRKIRTALLA